MKEKILDFFCKLKDTFFETLIYLICSFAGILINLVIVFGFLSFKIENYSFSTLIKTNEILFGILSSIVGVMMGIISYYFSEEKKRGVLCILVSWTLIFSVVFSVIALMQSQTNDFFSKEVLIKGTIVSASSMIVAALLFKYDQINALYETKIQNKANNSKNKKSVKVGNEEIKI